jgi:hypothetical protein
MGNSSHVGRSTSTSQYPYTALNMVRLRPIKRTAIGAHPSHKFSKILEQGEAVYFWLNGIEVQTDVPAT